MRINLDTHSNIIVNFPGKWVDTFRHYSYVDILTSYMSALEGEKGIVDLSELKDAICFVGITATAAPDSHPSPFESLYPGVGVHASLFNSMIYRKFISRVSRWTNIIILIVLAFLTYFCTTKSRKLLSLIYIVVLAVAFFVLALLLFFFFGIWINVFYPMTIIFLLYLVITFRKYIFEMHKREVLENELSIARNIQQSFLPKEKPEVTGIELEAQMLTARQVGGDLYDFVTISDKKAGIMIGDVSGKGVPAALYMAKVVSEFKAYAKEENASTVLLKLNDRLVAESGSNLFVTVAYLIFDMEKKIMNFSLGGHLPTVMLRKGEKDARLLDLKEGMPLGLMEGVFSDGNIDIKSGDLFILYTDGVTEAMNAKHEMFGEKQLVDIAKRHRSDGVVQIVKAIHDAVEKYEGKLPQHDDITVIAIRII